MDEIKYYEWERKGENLLLLRIVNPSKFREPIFQFLEDMKGFAIGHEITDDVAEYIIPKEIPNDEQMIQIIIWNLNDYDYYEKIQEK